MTIAVVVITKDEERNIDDCLESTRWADELVVVDAESRDRTVDIARKYTDKVFIRPWPGFGPQWNYGLDKATTEWVFVLAADERIPRALKEEILTVLADGPTFTINSSTIGNAYWITSTTGYSSLATLWHTVNPLTFMR